MCRQGSCTLLVHFVLFHVPFFFNGGGGGGEGKKYGNKNNNLMCFRIFVEEKMHESPHIWGRNYFWLKPVVSRQQVSAHGQNIGQFTLQVLCFPLWSVAKFGSFLLWMIASLVWLQHKIEKQFPTNWKCRGLLWVAH